MLCLITAARRILDAALAVYDRIRLSSTTPLDHYII
jgi:hypothetical protein